MSDRCDFSGAGMRCQLQSGHTCEHVHNGWTAANPTPECRDNRRRMHEGEVTGDVVKAAIDRAVERFGDQGDGLFNAAGFGVSLMELAGLKGAIDGNLVRAILGGRADVTREPDRSHFRRVTAAPAPAVEGEPPEMTLAEACDAVERGEQVELHEGEHGMGWRPFRRADVEGQIDLEELAQLARNRYRLKPAPALTRVQEMAAEACNRHGPLLGDHVAAAFERVLRMFRARVFELNGVGKSLAEAIGQAEREFLGPKGVR